MAVRKSIATGNFTAAGTWGLVDSTSYSTSEAVGTTLTTAYSGCRSGAFIPGAITVEGIAVKLANRTGTTGTMSVALYNNTLTADVAGTEVTINTADLPAAATSLIDGGWIYFKFASPVLLLVANSYSVEAKTSSASQVSLWRNTGTDIARALVTTTTGAPAAGDDLIIAGEYTAASTSATYTITMDNTASTDFGAAATSLVTPAVAICSKGILNYGVAASTNYLLKVSGNIMVFIGGEFNIGTVGAEIPRNSTAELLLDIATNVEYGIVVRSGTFRAQCLSRTSGKNIVQCKLNTDEAIASTSLGVDTDTGWLDNDQIAVASTTRTIADCELGALNGAAGASTLTVDGFAGAGGGLAVAHSGTTGTQAEIINITRNIKIHGTSITLQGYILCNSAAIVDWDWAEFYFIGSANSSKRGIELQQTSAGSIAINYCSFHNCEVASSIALSINGASRSATVSDCVFWKNNASSIIQTATSGADTITNCTSILTISSGPTDWSFNFGDVGSTITGITVVGNAANNVRTIGGIEISEAAGIVGTISNITGHSCASSGVSIEQIPIGTISNITAWRNNNDGLTIADLGSDFVLDGIIVFGNVDSDIGVRRAGTVQACLHNPELKNITSNAGTTFTSPIGLSCYTSYGQMRISDSSFGATTTHSTGDIVCTRFMEVNCQNTLMASSTEVATQSTLADSESFISSQKHDQTTGNHKMWMKYGTITIDTSIYDTTPSVRMTPNNASNKLSTKIRPFCVAVNSGGAVTVSVKVRESVVGDGTAYNGNRIRLMVKKNVAAGITADTLLATATVASVGAFETLSATTGTVTDDTILEFYPECDGTTGWINFDTWTATPTADTKGNKYWRDGSSFAYGDNSSGGGGSGLIVNNGMQGGVNG